MKALKSISTLILLVLLFNNGYSESDTINYFWQLPPGTRPVKFAEGFISNLYMAHDHIIINTNLETVLEVYNLDGQVVLKKQLSIKDNTIPVNDLKSGNYIVKLQTNSKVISNILIIE